MSILVVTAAPAFARKPKKRKAAAEEAERLKRESEARIVALYQMAMARTNQIATPSQPVNGAMNDSGASIVAPVTPATNAQFLADDAASVAPVVPAAGTLLISEFRLRGPSGANDEFIEIYNNSGADHTVAAISGSGYAVAASDGVVRCTIPNATVIPAGGHYLCANSIAYSLSTYATADATYTTDIPDNAGIALFNNNSGVASFSLANRFDAVGSTSEANTLYREGTGYPTLTPFSINYAFVRDECGKSGSITTMGPCTISTPKDTDNNAVDFYFVDTNGTSAGAGQRLGAPGPQNLASPIQRNSTITAALLDSTVSQSSPPNRVRDFTSVPAQNSTFGTLSIRRRFVNNTGANVTRLRFRVIDVTTFPAPSGFADLRPRTAATAVAAGINDPVTCLATGAPTTTPCIVTLQGADLEGGEGGENPSQPNGGGFNSSLAVGTITLGTPLANGASINVQFLLGIQQTGNFKLYVNVEALP
ncbi:MAG TPA: lamin tail domain-containing protein [Pyrinomonadaceae bacterium]|nr:lamin tail domain-containing protein [Pyrinomonadaceae bacterium]